jgi:methyl-accepting chemotaxis protein
METAAEQVASASGQVSSARQSLAQGASQQAASLEETTSSLAQMASMARGNAENARQADLLMGNGPGGGYGRFLHGGSDQVHERGVRGQ